MEIIRIVLGGLLVICGAVYLIRSVWGWVKLLGYIKPVAVVVLGVPALIGAAWAIRGFLEWIGWINL